MWIILVWIISGLCYMPLYFGKIGYQVPGILIQAKYIFVFVPLIISLVYLGKASIKNWIYNLITHKARFGIIGIIIVVTCTGIILGKCMTWYKNILAIAVLHTIFNVSFLMPVKGNVVAVLCLVIVLVVFEKIRGKNEVR